MRLVKVFYLCVFLFSAPLLAQNCDGPMNTVALKNVVEYLNKNNNELARLSFAKDILVRECLSCDQAIQILKTFKSAASREAFLTAVKEGRLVDEQNQGILEEFNAENSLN